MGFGKTLVELEDWHIALAYRTLFLSMGIVYRVKMCWFWMYTGQALVNSVEFRYPYGFHVYSILTTVWVCLTVTNNNIPASVRGPTNLFNLLTLCLSKWEWEQRQRGSLQARPRSRLDSLSPHLVLVLSCGVLSSLWSRRGRLFCLFFSAKNKTRSPQFINIFIRFCVWVRVCGAGVLRFIVQQNLNLIVCVWVGVCGAGVHRFIEQHNLNLI